MKTIHPGALVLQRPDTTVVYRLDPIWGKTTEAKAQCLRPARLKADTLRVEPAPSGLVVSGGVAGARYEIRVGERAFHVRVTHYAGKRRTVRG